MTEPSSLAAWLEKLEQEHPAAHIELGLERIRSVYQRLDLAPDCPVITVTGTNGKGSVSSMVAAMLRAGGYKVGLYQSPHLLRYNERIRINGNEVSDALICEAFAAVDAVRSVPSLTPLTYFEFGTLVAFWLFSRLKMDVWVLEVGLGGRYDAVNIVDPDLAIVTALDIDHTNYLGNDRDAIALEKAGIARMGRPLICGDPNPPQVFRDAVEQQGATPYYIGQDFGVTHESPQSPTWQFWRRTSAAWFWHSDDAAEQAISETWQQPVLPGEHQLNNAAVALMALHTLEPTLLVSRNNKQKGLANISLQGRLQTLNEAPWTLCDVAHNPHAARALRAYLDNHPGGTTYAVLAMLGDKDIAGTIAPLADIVDHWYIAPLPGPRGADCQRLRLAFEENNIAAERVQECPGVAEACQSVAEVADKAARIIVFGSFLTVAEALRSHILDHAYGKKGET